MNEYVFQLLIVVLFNAVSTSIQVSFDPKTICSLVVNGTKLKDPRACNKWIECINGKPINGTCPSNQFYDRMKMDCVPEQNITCITSNPCAAATKENHIVIDPYSCSGYYFCKDGVGTHGECPTGMNYNPGTQNCILNFPCVAKIDPDSYCNIVPDGVFIKNPKNCNGYQLCWNDEIVNGTCPEGFYFNASTGYCDYPDNVDCIDNVKNPFNASDPKDICSHDGDFVSDNRTCNGYYLCHFTSTGDIQLIHGTCPSGRFFNPVNGGVCIPRTDTNCSLNRCTGLGYSSIQMCNLSNDNCNGFGICQDGVSIGTGKCPNNQYFDEITQRCTDQVIKYISCIKSETN